MKTPAVQKFIKPGLPLIIVTVLFFLLSWSYNIFFRFEQSSILNTLIILACTILNGFLIAFINKKFAIIRTRTFLPVLIYFLLVTVWKRSFLDIYPHISLSIFLLCLIILMGMYKNRNAVVPALWLNLLISVISIVNPIYLLLIPTIYIGIIHLQSMSLKVFLSSVMGLLIPWIYYLSYRFYMGNEISNISLLINEFHPSIWIYEMLPLEMIYTGLASLIFILAMFGIYSNLFNDSLQTRIYINLYVFIFVYLFLLSFLFPSTLISILPIFVFLTSILLSHPFTLKHTKFTNYLFLLFCGMNILYMIYDILIA